MAEKQFYPDYSTFLSRYFGDTKIQKIAINAGMTCPNRDGTVGVGGCTFCNNQTFNPAYCHTEKSVSQQLEEGKAFFRRKYPTMKYMAYFQAYTGTYGEVEHLIRLYEEALRVEDIVGLVIGTRPDCLPETLVTYLSNLAKRMFVMVEIGIESTDDAILRHINRGHTYACAREAIEKLHKVGILTCGHLIVGLPGDTRERLIRQAEEVSELPLDVIKLHQLQIIRGTAMAKEFEQYPERFHLYTADEYIDLCVEMLKHLRPTLTVERFTSQSPKELLIAPDWGLKNHEFTNRLKQRLVVSGNLTDSRG